MIRAVGIASSIVLHVAIAMQFYVDGPGALAQLRAAIAPLWPHVALWIVVPVALWPAVAWHAALPVSLSSGGGLHATLRGVRANAPTTMPFTLGLVLGTYAGG